MRLLVVCTANRCRSPMAAALLQARLAGRPGQISVDSAGFGPPGYPAVAPAVTAMAEIGVDLTTHVSRRITAELCHEADLVVTMAAQHLVEIVVLDPGVWPRTFTLTDLVRRAQVIGPVGTGTDLAGWVQRAHAGRTRAGVLTAGTVDDIDDPTGLPDPACQRTRDQIDRLVATLVDHIALRCER